MFLKDLIEEENKTTMSSTKEFLPQALELNDENYFAKKVKAQYEGSVVSPSHLDNTQISIGALLNQLQNENQTADET